MRSEKKLILITAAVGLVLVLILSAILSMQLNSELPNGAKAKNLFGLLDMTMDDETAIVTAEKREEEYQSRLPLTSDIVGNFESKVLRFLSSGDYLELDDWLYRLETTYQEAGETSGQDLSYMSLIQNYRSDISIILSFQELSNKEDATVLLTKFQTPEVLASAIIYAPLSIKLDSIINQDSLILPAVSAQDSHLTALKKIDLGPDTYLPRVEEINRRRMPGDKIIGLALFEFHAYGNEYRIELVAQKDSTYAPYRIFRVENLAEPDEPVTVAYLKNFRAEYADCYWFDLDSFYVISSSTGPEE